MVVFYKSFNTTYQYTRIGKIINSEGLESILGKGNAIVGFN
ncbi:MAG: cyclophilin-like fold protein [Chitinophagaceae bacterium]